MSDHTRYRDDVGAYLLGALNELERQAFERHLKRCPECQEELDRLRPAADALPGSVEQLAPPPGLKARLMAEVEGDGAAAAVAELDRGADGPDGAARVPDGAAHLPDRAAGGRGRGWLGGLRIPRLAYAAAALLLGLVIGFGIAQLGGEDSRTVNATIAKA